MGFSRQEYCSGLPFLLQWTTFCQTSPPRPHRLGWPHTAGLSFTELDTTVVLGADWLVSVIMVLVCCPLIPSCNTYCLTWVSLTLDVGYLFRAAPAKHSCCSLPWTRGCSSLPLPSQLPYCSVAKSCLTLCDPMDCSMLGFPVLHYQFS